MATISISLLGTCSTHDGSVCTRLMLLLPLLLPLPLPLPLPFESDTPLDKKASNENGFSSVVFVGVAVVAAVAAMAAKTPSNDVSSTGATAERVGKDKVARP